MSASLAFKLSGSQYQSLSCGLMTGEGLATELAPERWPRHGAGGRPIRQGTLPTVRPLQHFALAN